MKKIIMILLIMVMVAGCVQAPTKVKKSKEPLIMEQPEKTVEQEKPEEYDQIFNTHENLENEKIIVETHQIDLKGNDLSSVSEPVVQSVIIDIDSDEARQVMDEINKEAENYFNELTFYPEDDETYQGHWHTVSFFRVNYYFSNHVLSIVTKANRYLLEAASGSSEYKVYNLDVDTKKQLSNEELLEQNMLSFNQANSIVNDFVKEANICSCEDAQNSNQYCYRSIEINNESLLYSDGEKINLILPVTLGVSSLNLIIPIIN